MTADSGASSCTILAILVLMMTMGVTAGTLTSALILLLMMDKDGKFISNLKEDLHNLRLIVNKQSDKLRLIFDNQLDNWRLIFKSELLEAERQVETALRRADEAERQVETAVRRADEAERQVETALRRADEAERRIEAAEEADRLRRRHREQAEQRRSNDAVRRRRVEEETENPVCPVCFDDLGDAEALYFGEFGTCSSCRRHSQEQAEQRLVDEAVRRRNLHEQEEQEAENPLCPICFTGMDDGEALLFELLGSCSRCCLQEYEAANVEQEEEENAPPTCPVCLDDITDHDAWILACGHCLHERCLQDMRRNMGASARCPLCRGVA